MHTKLQMKPVSFLKLCTILGLINFLIFTILQVLNKINILDFYTDLLNT